MDMDMDLPPKPILSRKVSDFFAIKMENCVYYYSSVFVSVRFCSVPFCVPFFVCCSLGNSEKKTEMHLFIAGQHAMQACRAARQPGRQTDLHWVPWTFWIIDYNIHSKQTDRQTDIHIYMYLSTSDLTQELVKILSDLCWLTSLRTKWKHTFPKTHIFHQCGYWTLIINSNIIRFDNCPCHRPEIRMFTLDKNSY